MANEASPINPVCLLVQRQLVGEEIRRELFQRRLCAAKNLYKKDLFAHYGCVNAIEFSNDGELLISGGDDRRILLWSIPQAIHDDGRTSPDSMLHNHESNIFCLSFNSENSRIFSGGNDDLVMVHDLSTKQLVVKLPHRKPVYGLSVTPGNDSVLATAGDDGRILIYDIREPVEPHCLAKHKLGFHSVKYNPSNASLLVAANSDDGILLFDARKPKTTLIHYDKDAGHISGISACFNSSGDRVLALRRRLPPVLYATQQRNALCQFYHPRYYNSCTMKTCCFAGDEDEYVLSGSDDFNLYMWRIPGAHELNEWGQSHLVLRGHRSIVNQVRYSPRNNLIASSGVEKMIKLWSTMNIGTWLGSLTRETNSGQRNVYSHEEYINLVGPTGQRISHDYSDLSTMEDVRMMAFFDSLIQREIENWQSQSEATLTSDSDSDSQVQERIRIAWHKLAKTRSADDVKKHKANRIEALIATKRNRLAKLALYRSSTLIQRNCKRNSYKIRATTSHKSKRRSTAFSTSLKHSSVRRKKCNRNVHHQNYEIYPHHQSIDVPSTSTGITAATSSRRSALFRLIELDSDEDAPTTSAHNPHCDTSQEAPEENLVGILPTPLNGSHDINVLEVASTNVMTTITPLGMAAGRNYSSLSDSECEHAVVTPVKRRRRFGADEVDSGFATGPSSSGRRMPFDSSDEENNYEKFRKRVKKARVNLRKQVGIDSDSN